MLGRKRRVNEIRQRAQPVIYAHGDHTLPRIRRPVIRSKAARTQEEGPAVKPDQHRRSAGILWRSDRQIQAVLRLRAIDPAKIGDGRVEIDRLRAGRFVRGGRTYARPWFDRLRRTPAIFPGWRAGIRHASKNQYAIFA